MISSGIVIAYRYNLGGAGVLPGLLCVTAKVQKLLATIFWGGLSEALLAYNFEATGPISKIRNDFEVEAG